MKLVVMKAGWERAACWNESRLTYIEQTGIAKPERSEEFEVYCLVVFCEEQNAGLA